MQTTVIVYNQTIAVVHIRKEVSASPLHRQPTLHAARQRLLLEISSCSTAFSFVQKEMPEKENEPGGFRFPPAPHEATKKTASVFLDLSRENWSSSKNPTMHCFYGNLRKIRNFPHGPMWTSAPTELRRIRAALQFQTQSVFAAAIQTQLLTNSEYHNRQRVS